MRLGLLLLAACSDYKLGGDATATDPFDDGTGDSVPTDTATDPADEEVCNGVDDDADGAVDEGFADTDRDGLADCVDPICPDLEIGVAGVLALDPDCPGESSRLETPVKDPWDLRVDAQIAWTSPDFVAPVSTPLVVYLDDDDGDGAAGPGDGLEILFQSGGSNEIVVLDAATATEKRRIPGGNNAMVTPAVADVEGDGVPELFTVWDNHPRAIDPDGRVLWTAIETPGNPSIPFLYVADIDADGDPELLVDDLVYDADSGAFEARWPTGGGYAWRNVVAADLDLDGTQEVLLAGEVFRADGTGWSSTRPGTYAWWALPVQADEDPEGEAVFVGDGFGVYDTDGTELAWTAFPAGEGAGAPTAADFDGDGVQEVAVPLYYQTGVRLYELDGSEAWTVPGPWRSYGAGLSGFDFDGDGAFELIHPADEDLYVLDGASGAVRMTWTDHVHPTALEYATVADADADGAAEIVVSTIDSAFNAVSVLGHDGPGWAPGRDGWAMHDFAPGNLGLDHTVPLVPEPAWTCPGVWRALPAVDAECGEPDLVVHIVDVCVEDCVAGPGWVSVQVGNEGSAGTGGVVLDLYARVGGKEHLVEHLEVGSVAGGTWADGVVVEVPTAWVGADRYRAVVGYASGAADVDCEAEDNEDTWTDACVD